MKFVAGDLVRGTKKVSLGRTAIVLSAREQFYRIVLLPSMKEMQAFSREFDPFFEKERNLATESELGEGSFGLEGISGVIRRRLEAIQHGSKPGVENETSGNALQARRQDEVLSCFC